MLSGILWTAQTVLGVYLKRTCSRDTSASSALGVLNNYALHKSMHVFIHSLLLEAIWRSAAHFTEPLKPPVSMPLGFYESQWAKHDICKAKPLIQHCSKGNKVTSWTDKPSSRWPTVSSKQQLPSSNIKGKVVFPYSLPSVGPGADPGVQAVSPQVTSSESRHRRGSRLPLLSARPAGYLRSFHQMALPVNGSTHLIPAYYSFIDPERMKGWVGLVGWPVADSLPTLVVTHQLQVERRTGNLSLSRV